MVSFAPRGKIFVRSRDLKVWWGLRILTAVMWTLFVLAADTLVVHLPASFQTVDRVPIRVEARFTAGGLDTSLSGVVSLQLREGGIPIGTQYYFPLSLVMQRGVAQGTLQVYRAGTFALVATAPGGLVGTSEPFTVSPGPYEDVVLLLPGQILDGGYPGWRRVGLPAPDRYAVDQSVPYAVLLVDPFGNPVPGASDSFQILPVNSQGTGGRADVQGGPVLQTGDTLRIRPRVADSSFSVVVQGRSGAQDTSAAVVAFPSSAQGVVLLVPGETLLPGGPAGGGKTGTPQPQNVNVPFRVDLVLVDSLFNPVAVTDPFRMHSFTVEFSPVPTVGTVTPPRANFGTQNTLAFQVSFSQVGTWGVEGVDADSPAVRSGVTLIPVTLLAETLWVEPRRDTVSPGGWETLRVHVEAPGGVPVPAAQVRAILQGPGTLLGGVATTDSTGIARFYYQAPLTLEVQRARVVFTHGTLSDAAELWTLAVADSVLLMYPNPLTSPPGRANIMIFVPAVQDIAYAELMLYDLTGAPAWRKVLQAGELSPGVRQVVVWDGTNDRGKRVAQGPYMLVYRVIGSGGRVLLFAKRMVAVVW